jgi:hypothetical protein
VADAGSVGLAPDGGAATDGGPATDGGTVSCTTTGKLVANTGTGNACGIKPVLGPPRTLSVRLNARLPDGGFPSGELCDLAAPSDGAGNLLVESFLLNPGDPISYSSLYAFDSSGAPLGQAVASISPVTAFPLSSGWLVGGFTLGPSLLDRYPPSLQGPFSVLEGAPPFAAPLLPPGGGTAFVAAAVQPSDDSCAEPLGRLFAASFDASGAAAFRDVPLGCVPELVAISMGKNAAGDLLVLVGGTTWHVSPTGASQMVSPPPQAPFARLQPLVDGRFALNDARTWTATIDLSGNASPPPCWLAERSDVSSFQTVLGGQAYVAYHTGPLAELNDVHACDTYAELVLPDGTSCGFIPLTGTTACNPDTVSVGLDGTLTTLDLRSGCTASFWPGVFR